MSSSNTSICQERTGRFWDRNHDIFLETVWNCDAAIESAHDQTHLLFQEGQVKKLEVYLSILYFYFFQLPLIYVIPKIVFHQQANHKQNPWLKPTEALTVLWCCVSIICVFKIGLPMHIPIGRVRYSFQNKRSTVPSFSNEWVAYLKPIVPNGFHNKRPSLQWLGLPEPPPPLPFLAGSCRKPSKMHLGRDRDIPEV